MHPGDCNSTMGHLVLAIICNLAAMAIIVVGMRLYSQHRIVRKLGWPDTFILLSLVSNEIHPKRRLG